MAEDNEPKTVPRKCMKGHTVNVTEDMLGINKTGQAFKVLCPEEGCGMPVPISKEDVADLVGLLGDERKNVLEYVRVKNGGDPSTPIASVIDEINDEKELLAAANGEEKETSEIYEPLPAKNPVGRPPKSSPSAVVREPAREQMQQRPQRQQMTREPAPVANAFADDDNVELSPRDILIQVIEEAGLPPKETAQLTELSSYDDNWDPYTAKNLFETFGLTGPNVSKLTNRFRNQLDIYRKRQERANDLMRFVSAKTGGVRRAPMGGYMGEDIQAQGQYRQQQDACSAAVQAIITAANGIITPQTMAAIDAVRAAYGQAGANLASLGAVSMPNSGNVQAAVQQSQMTMMQMFREMMEANTKQKETEESKAKEKAELQQRFDEMKSLIMMVATKPATPAVAPQDSENKMLLDTLLTIVKDKVATPPVSTVKSREDMMFEQMFGMFIETAKGKPNEAIQPLLEQIAELKDNVGRLGGGFQGLPTNTDQLHGIIDYTKAMAEIKKTEHEFADKAANRELITTLAQTAFQSIGEAAASVFMQNPGTPEQAPVSLPEQPIDDGSVVSVQCPQCKALMTAPKGAPAIRCPSCNSVFDRVQQQKSPEEVAKISQEQLAQMEQEHKEQELATKPRKTFESPEMPRTGPLSAEDLDLTPTSTPGPKGAPTVDHEPGPLSRSIMNSKKVTSEPESTPPEPTSTYETDISQPEEHPTSG